MADTSKFLLSSSAVDNVWPYSQLTLLSEKTETTLTYSVGLFSSWNEILYIKLSVCHLEELSKC